MNKTVSILGATGSVGRQTLDVVRKRGYRVEFLSAKSDVCALESAAREFKPTAVAMSDPDAAADLSTRLSDTDIRVLSGEEGIVEGVRSHGGNVVLNAIMGSAGLSSTLAAIESGRTLALANKESLVTAGKIVMSTARAHGSVIIPVDSEHSAIFQSLRGGDRSEVKGLILTASGGPFYGRSREELSCVTLEETLAHPTWRMGKKITVDSATLMNKGFEIIEAAHLFDLAEDKIRVVIHRESILHSAVEYIDNTVIGELSVPDMRACIQYAVDYPTRYPASVAPLDLFAVGSLSFAKPDTEAFPLLSLARDAARDGGAMGSVLNAADEVAVSAFLQGRISFAKISDTVIQTYRALSDAKSEHTIEAIRFYDATARRIAESLIG